MGLATDLSNVYMTDASPYQAVGHDSEEKMSNYLLHERGGDSLRTFLKLTKLSLRNTHEYSFMTNEEAAAPYYEAIFERVKTKPLLVCGFHVYKHFTTKGKFTFDAIDFDTRDPDEEPTHHSMLLIGARRTSSGFYFLLQNFWAGAYFVEVSKQYLFNSHARVYYILSEVRALNEPAHRQRGTRCTVL